ncbi:MAG: hypothetical protein K8S55_10280 [Phycisphaerae bacterium]|nr:hypothetical protein [Phycisphaerae bacterium]
MAIRCWDNINFSRLFLCAAILGLGLLPMTAFCDDDEGPAPVRLEDLRTTKPAEKTPDAAKPDKKKKTSADSKTQEKPSSGSSIPVTQPNRQGADEAEIARRLRHKPPVPVTNPTGGKQSTPVKGPSLPKDGTMVLRRDGYIAREKKKNKSDKDSPWLVVTFVNDSKHRREDPRRLLPCRLLESVEKILAKTPNARFRISGETTNDGKYAYLLLRRVSVIDEPKPIEKSADTEKTKANEEDSANTSKSGTKTAKAAPKTAATTSDLISGMLKDDSGKAVLVTPAPTRSKAENKKSVAPAGYVPEPGKQRLVIDRLIRVIRSKDGQWHEARFESDNTLRDPPMKLLPGQMLLRAIVFSKTARAHDLLLEVSGEVTYYRNQRYLLLRKVIRQRDMNQF